MHTVYPRRCRWAEINWAFSPKKDIAYWLYRKDRKITVYNFDIEIESFTFNK
jgi:hypothetical protein